MSTVFDCVAVRGGAAATLAIAMVLASRAGADGDYEYPAARRGDTVDDYHGVQVPDPFRWLEDPDSPESRAWIDAQNALTSSYLESIAERGPIRERLTALWDYERYGVPSEHGGRYFYERNDGLQNQAVLYWAPSLDAEPRLLLDPNTLSDDGTVALSGTAVSDDGRYLAYGLAAAGSDWQEWRVREVESGKDLPDLIRWVKFSGASWTPDGAGFYYSRYDEPEEGTKFTGANYFQKLYYHKLGAEQSQDELVYERPDEKEWGFRGQATDDGRFVIVSVWKGTLDQNLVFYLDREQPGAEMVKLIDQFEADYVFLGNDGPVLYFQTDLEAPRYRIIAIDTREPARDKWREIVPESENVLSATSLTENRFFAEYLEDARSLVKVFDLAGKFERDIALPGVGTASGFHGDRDATETFYAFSSFTAPTTIYRYDIASGASSVFRRPDVAFDSDAYETRQVFYESKDGTRVPMFLVHRRGLQLDGTNPTLLYSYGGFNIVQTPSFSVSRAVWLEMGGVFALANLRGGGEYGREWHEAGMKDRKQNVFDDFIAAAEWLIANRYTSTERLAINGRSNGGLLIGAVMTQRPELFGATLPGVGVLDMLRFHRFTIGWAWTSEYGSADNADDFPYLFKYSPLHNIKQGMHYPPTMITTADHDDRVVPAHSFKFAAALQAAQGGPAPVLIRIETSAGHGAGKPTAKVIEEVADTYAFLVRELRMKLPGEFGASAAK